MISDNNIIIIIKNIANDFPKDDTDIAYLFIFLFDNFGIM